tara:strand:- start:142 stop:510 length:369 start_codon:yes stop_codon:yes gene_type:complete
MRYTSFASLLTLLSAVTANAGEAEGFEMNHVVMCFEEGESFEARNVLDYAIVETRLDSIAGISQVFMNESAILVPLRGTQEQKMTLLDTVFTPLVIESDIYKGWLINAAPSGCRDIELTPVS